MMLREHIEAIRDGIRAGKFQSEAAVSEGIVLRLLHALDWPRYEPQVVFPQYSVKGGWVDYALCHPASRPVVFIEVKQLGQCAGAEEQLFQYAFHRGVPMAILTDGQQWHFFHPHGGQGNYEERRVYLLDLLEIDVGESIGCLDRYLKYSAYVQVKRSGHSRTTTTMSVWRGRERGKRGRERGRLRYACLKHGANCLRKQIKPCWKWYQTE